MSTNYPARRFSTAAYAAIAVASLLVAAVAPAAGQFSDVAAASSSTLAPGSSAGLSQRDAEYAALARDVESLGREFGLVKRVVKLVTPAVVHIEATSRNIKAR
jgi:hypothetical protein